MPLWDNDKHYAVFMIIRMMHRNNNATGILMNFGNIYEQLDNMHMNVPKHSYQYDKSSYAFQCIIQMFIMYSYQICSIYKSSKSVNKY